MAGVFYFTWLVQVSRHGVELVLAFAVAAVGAAAVAVDRLSAMKCFAIEQAENTRETKGCRNSQADSGQEFLACHLTR